jgi:hypothetical protein
LNVPNNKEKARKQGLLKVTTDLAKLEHAAYNAFKLITFPLEDVRGRHWRAKLHPTNVMEGKIYIINILLAFN